MNYLSLLETAKHNKRYLQVDGEIVFDKMLFISHELSFMVSECLRVKGGCFLHMNTIWLMQT